MARFRQDLHPVNSEKHENTWSFLNHNASAVQIIEIVSGVRSPSANQEVPIGSKVNSVYFEWNLNGVDNSGTAQVFHWTIVKDPGTTFSTAELDPALYNTKIKKFIIKRGMEMLPQIPTGSGGTVQTKRIFVVKLNRYSRMGDTDKLFFCYKSTSASQINFCGITIFKSII